MNPREEKKEGGSLVTLLSSPSVFLYFVPLPTTWTSEIGYAELLNDEKMEEERWFFPFPQLTDSFPSPFSAQ